MEGIPNKKQEPLPIEDAQKEAGMARALLHVNPANGGMDNIPIMFGEGQKPTSEDYEAAFNAIEELKEIAKNESGAEAVNVLAKLGAHSKFALNMVAAVFAPGGGVMIPSFQRQHDEAIFNLDSASEKLKKLKEQAEIYDKEDSAAR